jgi:hypothetical protein
MFKFSYAASIGRELAGSSSAVVTRSLGRRRVYAPLFLVGYMLLLIGLARLVANSLGWNGNLFLVGLGAVHVALGLLAVTAAADPADAGSEEAFLASGPPLETAFDRADTLVTGRPPSTDTVVTGALRPPPFPPRTRISF